MSNIEKTPELPKPPFDQERAKQPRLFQEQRLALDRRAAYIKRIRVHGEKELDPVLRHHLGLAEEKAD